MEKDETISFLKERFGEYYRKNGIELPDRFGKREFAFMPFGVKMMKRHLSFKRKSDLINYITNMVPAHAYYSSAFYQNPGAPTMEEKGWMGAELIFDLDLDHLEKKKARTYEEGLRMIKEEFTRLVEEFILGDFGFDEKYVKLYFSGGRGYHCHVTDPRVLHLDSSGRREIVDYIMGKEMDERTIFRERVVESNDIGRRRSIKRLEIPRPDEPGWRGRVGRSIIDMIKNLDDENLVRSLIEAGVKKKNIERLRSEMTPERILRIEREGWIDQSPFIRRFFLKAAIRRIAISSVAGETDEPVTCDVKRLIRLPTSLHGKTGFRVCPIDIDDLEDFDPLYDAVVFGDDPVIVELKEKFAITLKGETFNLAKGKCRVPEYVAVFLAGRGIAKVINSE